MMGLKGAQRIIFEELQVMLDSGEPVSIHRLANRSAYHPSTVFRTLQMLETFGLVRIHRTRNGCRSVYAIPEDACYNS